jgi:hypothetical protein
MKKIWMLAVLLGICGWAFGADKALDREGNFYTVFPTVVNDVPVLQMQIFLVTGAKTFMTVPGSEGPEIEANPQIYLSTNAKKCYVAYERWGTSSSRIILATYVLGQGFLDPLTVSESGDGTVCMNPVLAQTWEIYTDESGNKTMLQFLHLVWWENGASSGAVYCNFPITLGTMDPSAKTLIRLSDLVSPAGVIGDLSGVSPHIYQSPAIFIPARNQNSLFVVFADLSSLQYQVLSFRYGSGGSDTANDRAHFPDIGVVAPIAFPNGFTPGGAIAPILGTDGRLGLYSMSTAGTQLMYYCQGWSTVVNVPVPLSGPEVGGLLDSLVNDSD